MNRYVRNLILRYKDYKEAIINEINTNRFYYAFLLLILMVSFYLYMKFRFFERAFTWDEANYAGTARTLYRNFFDYSMNGEPQLYLPPVYPYLLAIFYKIFGLNEASIRLVNPILGVLTLIILFSFARRLFDINVALISTILLSAYYLHWIYSDRLMTDVLFELLVLGLFYTFYIGFEDEKPIFLYISGVLLGISYLTRYSTPILLLILFLYVILSRKSLDWIKKKEIWLALLCFIMIIAPYEMWKAQLTGKPFGFFQSFLGGWAGGYAIFPWYMFGKWLFFESDYFNRSLLIFGILAVLGIFITGMRFFDKNTKEDLLLLIWFFLPFIVASLHPHKESRYLLFIVPALVIMTSNAILLLGNLIARHAEYPKYGLLIAILFSLMCSYQTALPATDYFKYAGSSWVQLKNAGEFIDKNTPKDTKIISESVPQLYYYSDRIIVPFPKNKTELLRKSLEKNIDLIVLTPERMTPNYAFEFLLQNPDLFIPYRFFVDNPRQPRDFALVFKINKNKIEE
ncbi:MAG: ArnT family glycosyltransferase, partial [Methanosarcinales archaeon]